MLAVNLICIGKLKEGYLREASAEYTKRLSAFCKLNIVELPEHRLSSNPSAAEIEKGLNIEGETILAALQKVSSNHSCAIALCIEGKECSSPALAERIASLALNGESEISFIIGGSFGLSDSVKRRADWKLSMSPMTFPHQLARIMLLEQIYRAFSINANSKYHK